MFLASGATDYSSDYWKNKIASYNEQVRQHPEIHQQYKKWFFDFKAKYGYNPTPHQTTDKLDKLLYVASLRSSSSTAVIMPPTKRLRLATQARLRNEMIDATEAVEKAKERALTNAILRAPRPIQIIPTSLPSYRAARASEVKGVDVDISVANVLYTTNTSNNFVLINPVQQGDGPQNRDGREIVLNNARIKLSLVGKHYVEAVTGDVYGGAVRCIVIWDRSPNGVLPNFNYVFGQISQSGVNTCTWASALNYVYMSRFKVLRDIVVDFEPPGGNAMMPTLGTAGTQGRNYNEKNVDIFIPFKAGKYKTVYAGTADPITIAQVGTGALYIAFVAHTIASPTTPFSVEVASTSFCRLRFQG